MGVKTHVHPLGKTKDDDLDVSKSILANYNGPFKEVCFFCPQYFGKVYGTDLLVSRFSRKFCVLKILAPVPAVKEGGVGTMIGSSHYGSGTIYI